jgi:hypothetical protein
VDEDTVDLFGTVNSGSCSAALNTALEFGSSSVGQRTVVYYVRLASGGLNPGWTIDGETVTLANTARLRICNNTGANADPPNLVFSLMTVSVP